jgi:hypothetical protein
MMDPEDIRYVKEAKHKRTALGDSTYMRSPESSDPSRQEGGGGSWAGEDLDRQC